MNTIILLLLIVIIANTHILYRDIRRSQRETDQRIRGLQALVTKLFSNSRSRIFENSEQSS
jgi:low affinity Fe/Cu permease